MSRPFSSKIASALVLTVWVALLAPLPSEAGVPSVAPAGSSGWRQAWVLLQDLWGLALPSGKTAPGVRRTSPSGRLTALRAKDGSFIDPNGRTATASSPSPVQPIGGN